MSTRKNNPKNKHQDENFYLSKQDIISPKFLISEEYLKTTKSQLSNDKTFKIWFNTQKGSTEVNGGDFGRQIIQAKPIKKNISKKIMNKLSPITRWARLSIESTKRQRNANVKIYLDKTIDIDPSKNFLGIATLNKNQKSTNSFWEVFLNARQIKSKNQLVFTALHEIGHTLGLEHPHDTSDNDFYSSAGMPSKGHTWQTVMSISKPESMIYPNKYQFNDLKALQIAWGQKKKHNHLNEKVIFIKKPKLNLKGDISTQSLERNDFIINGRGTPNLNVVMNILDEEWKTVTADERGKFSFELTRKDAQILSLYPGLVIQIQQTDLSSGINYSQDYIFTS